MIGTYTHGGNVYHLQGDISDFSVNLNPMGMPPCVIQAGQRAMAAQPRYPDPFCRVLTEAISARDGVSPDMVLCGNGASDLIDRLVRAAAPKTALISVPTFTEYEKQLELNNCKVIRHYEKEANAFGLNASILKEISPEVQMMFLCTPNNPTGQLVDAGLLHEILARCRKIGTLLVLDQCFLDLCEGVSTDLTEELEGGGLVLLRALTKNYAMAPLRVGYCLCANQVLLTRMAELGQPWAVSVPAQEAGAAALLETPDWPKQFMDWLPRERTRLMEAVTQAGGQVFPSEANFFLFRWRNNTLCDQLIEHKILIRQCSDFIGLGPEFFRCSVQTPSENDRLICALKQIGK